MFKSLKNEVKSLTLEFDRFSPFSFAYWFIPDKVRVRFLLSQFWD